MIHVRHLAEAYSYLISNPEDFLEMRPAEYTGNILDFANRFISEISNRIGCSCEINESSMSFDEPLCLINKTHVSEIIENYNQEFCWEELTKYYKLIHVSS